MNIKNLLAGSLTILLLSACASTGDSTTESVKEPVTQETTNENSQTESKNEQSADTDTAKKEQNTSTVYDDVFSSRDLEQSVDASQMETLSLSDGQQTVISTEGIYEVSGDYKNSTIVIEAGDQDKVQLVLNDLTITNDNFPAIYVKSADKLFVTTTGTNTLAVTGDFTADGDTNTDAVIFSRDDLTLNGTGVLNITSTNNGISGKDEIRITGGTINIASTEDGIEAHDRIAVADGQIAINSYKDAFHCEYDDDLTVGDILIYGGTFVINASDDGFQATTDLIVNGGDFDINAAEGMEATFVTINGGTIRIEASDDGINAAQKSSSGTPSITFNGGDITIVMGAGDTDAVDSNGNLTVNGGTLNITAQSPFDYDGKGEKNGGTIIVNGTETDQLQNQFGGGGMMGGGRGNRF